MWDVFLLNSSSGGAHAFTEAYITKETVPTNGISETHSEAEITEKIRDVSS